MRPHILGSQVCEIQIWSFLKFCDISGIQSNSRVLEESALLVLWKRQTLSGESFRDCKSVLCALQPCLSPFSFASCLCIFLWGQGRMTRIICVPSQSGVGLKYGLNLTEVWFLPHVSIKIFIVMSSARLTSAGLLPLWKFNSCRKEEGNLHVLPPLLTHVL